MVVHADGEGANQLRWSLLRKGDELALRQAEAEAWEIARALAIESLVSDADAELAELEGRQRHFTRAAWPNEPLEGFRMQSSLGAFVVARVAMAWVPSAQTGLRHTALAPEGVMRGLVNHGVEHLVAQSVLGAWSGVPGGFKGDDEQGLDAGTLAGLAERSLTYAERDTALAQVAFSPRDLARLGASLTLSRRVRRLLGVLPNRQIGEEFGACLALVATQRPERVRELLGASEDSVLQRTVLELASTLTQFSQGEPTELSEDSLLPLVPSTPASSLSPFLAPASEDSSPLEEGPEAEDTSTDEPVLRPTLPTWWPTEDGDASPLWSALARLYADGQRGPSILGFGPGLGNSRGNLLPPVPGVFTADTNLAEPFSPVVRVLLRAVVAASAGAEPAVANANGCRWFICRAVALSCLVRGELDQGLSVLEAFNPDEAPELRWLRDRKIRFDGRKAEPLSPSEARRAAATLVLDLARAWARTLMGAAPDPQPSDEH